VKHEDPKDDIKLYVCMSAIIFIIIAIVGGH